MIAKNDELSPEIDALLSMFAAAEDPSARLQSLTNLMKQRALHGVRNETRFLDGIAKSATDARKSPNELYRLMAISLLGRVASVLKTPNARISEQLQTAVELLLPPLSMLGDADDRYYVAKALRYATGSWVVSYVAQAIVDEETGENVRGELTDVLLQCCDDLTCVFNALAAAIAQFKPATEMPGDSVARRMRRILSALRPRVVAVVTEAGDGLSEAASRMFAAGVRGNRVPETVSLREELAEELAGLVHDLVRTQLTILTEPTIYSVLEIPRSWFPAGLWQRFANQSKAVRNVAGDLAAAVTLLAKQGVMDSDLITQIERIAGSKEAAGSITAQIAERHLELRPDVREWLRLGGRARQRTALAFLEESQQLDADSMVAVLLVDSEKTNDALADLTEEALTELGIFEPKLAPVVKLIMTRCQILISDIRQLANKRNLRVRGTVGEKVEYSATTHELAGGIRSGVRWVRIIRPLVERVASSGTKQIVLKALVEEARGEGGSPTASNGNGKGEQK